ncbi:MAG: CBS domain-containing protein [Chloroflexi bacterium]|nr:CBS domain-containing protein [Anaerolineaceae bacterium]NMB87212.1 CBS domain-containing protein [Chloroflexota bacterium]
MSSIRQLLQLKGDFIWCVTPEATVYDALRLMAEKDIGAVLVMVDDLMVGIMSERDYARKIVLLGKTSRDTRVGEIMTEKVITIHPSQTSQEAVTLMTKNHIRHLPVVEEEHIIGIISVMDVMRDIIYEQREKIKSLSEKVSGNKLHPQF